MATKKTPAIVRYGVAGQEVTAKEVADLLRREGNRTALSVTVEAPPPARGPGFVPASAAVAFEWIEMARVFDAKLRADQRDLDPLPDELLLPLPGDRIPRRAAMIRQCMAEFTERVALLTRDALGRAVEESYSAAHLTIRAADLPADHSFAHNPDALLSTEAKPFRDYEIDRAEARTRQLHPVPQGHGGGRKRGSRKPLQRWERDALERFHARINGGEGREEAAFAVQAETDEHGKKLFPLLRGYSPLAKLRRLENRITAKP